MRELLREDMTAEAVREYALGLTGPARIRLDAVVSVYEDRTLKEVAEEAGVPPSTVMDWLVIFKEEGPVALARLTSPGRLPRTHDGDELLALARSRKNKVSLLVAAMAYRGAPADQIADFLRVDLMQVQKWLATFRKDGPAGLTRYKKRRKTKNQTPAKPKRGATSASDVVEPRSDEPRPARYMLRSDFDALSLFSLKEDFLPEFRPRFAAIVAAYMASDLAAAASQRNMTVDALVAWLDDFNVEGIQKMLRPGKVPAGNGKPAWPNNAFNRLSDKRLEELEREADSDAAKVRLGALRMLARGVPIDVVARRHGETVATVEGWVAAQSGASHLLGAVLAITGAEA